MNTTMHGGGRRRSLWKGPALTTALFLLIPLLGNTFVEGWHWKFGGFVVFGTFIFGLGLTYELVTRKVETIAYRVALGIALAAGFVLVWGNFVQAADDINPNAMMYLWVPLVGTIGAAIARFRPAGMARALFVTALAQALVLAIALMIRNPQVTSWTPAVLRGFGMNALLAMVFVGSAFLFRKARRGESAPGANLRGVAC
jgi:hypothetical protein